jgi:hypothetical protein
MMIVPQRQHGAEARLRLRELPAVAQQVAELVVRLGEIRIERDGRPKRRFRFGRTARRRQREAEVVANVGPCRRQGGGALEMGDGHRRVPQAQRHDAEQLPGAGVAGRAREQRPAARRGILQPARRLLGNGAREQRLGRRLLCARRRRGVGRAVHCINRICPVLHALDRTKVRTAREFGSCSWLAPRPS